MKIVKRLPPNFEAIAQVLPDAHTPGVIFCYGDTIYNPSGGKISRPLKAHEFVHSVSQEIIGVDEWWSRYLTYAQFRYDEELPAHRAEYATYCETEADRQHRFAYLVTLADRLSGPLYGCVVDFAAAKAAIKADR